MDKKFWIQELQSAEKFFWTATGWIEESHKDFKPAEESLTVLQQIGHVGQSVDWFLEGAFSDSGFDTNFDTHWGKVNECSSLEEAKTWVSNSFREVIQLLERRDVLEWTFAIAEGPIMGGAPRYAILPGIIDHTAHHRGSLSVYARMLGIEPSMPYAE